MAMAMGMDLNNGSDAAQPPNPGLIDFSAPLRGVVLCCTSIPPDTRTALAKHAEQMGASHKYDLTSEVTHLIVGEYDTPKYRYVAKERPDVKVLTPEWVEAIRQLWMADQAIDLEGLELKHTLPTLTSLKICMTGFEDPERSQIIDLVHSNGGDYHGDLTKSITHLIAREPRGNKYTFAKQWKLRLVSAEWLYDSIKRGMILDEKLYDPEIAPEERGKGAWVRRNVVTSPLGKRARDNNVVEDGTRKLRRTLSTKLTSQNEVIWGDIVGGSRTMPGNVEKPGQAMLSLSGEDAPSQLTLPNRSDPVDVSQRNLATHTKRGTFNNCRFYIYGFESRKAKTMCQHLISHDAVVCESTDDLATEPPARGYMVVPHEIAPSELLALPQGIPTVTEWWVERCLEKKECLEHSSSTFDLPFPHRSIERFDKLTISTTGFTGYQLLHLSKVVKLMGGTYDEFFSEKTSVLVCNIAQQLRIEKLQRAKEWKIPVVSIDWLLESIRTGSRQSYKPYILRSKVDKAVTPVERISLQATIKKELEYDGFEDVETISKSTAFQEALRPAKPAQWDSTAFEDDDEPTEAIGGFLIPKKTAAPPDTTIPTEPAIDLPIKLLAEISSNSPRKSPISPVKQSITASLTLDTQEISSAITSLLAKSKNQTNNGDCPPGGSDPTMTRATRKPSRILGRAQSNVSAASRASSVDSTASGGQAVHWPTKGNSLTKTNSVCSIVASLAETEKVESQPPQTQRLQYEDEEGEICKAQVIARMTGKKPKKKERERVATVGSLDDTPRGRNLRTKDKSLGMK